MLDTSAGRVAYVGGTRFAVHWVAQAVKDGMTPEDFAADYDLPVERVRAALAYAAAFPAEIAADARYAEVNRQWVEQQDVAWRAGKGTPGTAQPKARRKAAA